MLRIGIAQTANHYEYDLNQQAIVRALEVHAKNAVDLVLFPECATTGYNRGLLTIDEPKLRAMIETIQAQARRLKIAVAVPTPWPRGDGKFFNSLMLISESGEIIQRLDKVGFQRGEDRLFVPGEPCSRAFNFKGTRVGVLICIEASNGAWSFLKPEDQCDVILWPGFYGNKPGQRWEHYESPDDLKIKANIGSWKSAMVQVTCASSPESQHWPDRVFGGSVVLDRMGKCVFTAKQSAEDMIAIDFKGGELLSARSIF